MSGEISGRRDGTDAGIDEVFRGRARGNDLRESARIFCLRDGDDRSQQIFREKDAETIMGNHGCGVRIVRRELAGLVEKVDQRKIVAGNAAPSCRQSFGWFFSDPFELARRLPAASPIISVDLTQPFRQSNDAPQVFHLMIAEQIASRNDSPVFGADSFAMNPDRQPLSEVLMKEHTVLHAGKDRLAAIDPVVDSDPILPFAAIEVSGDTSVL